MFMYEESLVRKGTCIEDTFRGDIANNGVLSVSRALTLTLT